MPQCFHIQFMLETMQDLVTDDTLVSQADHRLTFRCEGLVTQAPERFGRFGRAVRITVSLSAIPLNPSSIMDTHLGEPVSYHI